MTQLLNPDMPAQELRLHMGELTADELRVARAAIAWANTRHATVTQSDGSQFERTMDNGDHVVTNGKIEFRHTAATGVIDKMLRWLNAPQSAQPARNLDHIPDLTKMVAQPAPIEAR